MSHKEDFSPEYLEAWNSYFYPNTNVFINKLGITNYDELRATDTELTFKRLVELGIEPIKGNFDKQHFIAIHKYLFQDLYDWAGEYRTVYMSKNQSYFAPVSEIDAYLDDAFNLMNDELKTVTSSHYLIPFLAKYFVILLDIHPFREGNGRTVKEFFSEFVLENTKYMQDGPFELDWSAVDKDALEEAMVLARAFKYPVEAELRKALKRVELEESVKHL